MADRTVSQEAILMEQTTFKLRRNGQTDYSILDDVIDETVTFTPEGGETKSFVAASGKSLDVPTKVKFMSSTFTLWLSTSDIEVLRSCFGEPIVTGTSPYTHTFNLETLSQQVDIYIEGPRYSNSADKVTFTGSAASIKFDDLSIQKEELMKYRCTVKVPAQNFDLAILYSSDLS